MKDLILKLKEIEEKEDLKIIFAVLSGSRAYGYDDENSDYDIKFVYKRDLNYYLKLENKKDSIEYIEDIYDFKGFDLNKALRLAYSANPNLIEMIYIEPIYFNEDYEYLKKIISEYYSSKSSILFYASNALSHGVRFLVEEEVELKKYLLTVRNLYMAKYLKENEEFKFLTFKELMDLNQNEFSEFINELYLLKKEGKGKKIIKRNDLLNDYIFDEITYLEEYADNLDVNHKDFKLLDEAFLKIINKM